jgi:hypothetical protein
LASSRGPRVGIASVSSPQNAIKEERGTGRAADMQHACPVKEASGMMSRVGNFG